MCIPADDTVCSYSSTNLLYLNNVMNKASKSFLDWCGLNRLTLNLGKCKAMVISGSTQKKKLRNNESLDLVCEYKYLGVILNESLNFHSHIKMIKQKVKQRS